MILFRAVVMIFFLGTSAYGANVATSDVGLVQQKKWHILLDMNHQPAVREDQFSFTDFTFFFDYQLDAKNSLRILQAPTRSYEIGATRGENEWLPSDTILTHFWNMPWTVPQTGTRFRLVSAVNLPTSIESQDNQKVVTFGHTLQINTMVAGRLLLSLRPFYRYNWYQFNTTPGGFPLPLLSYGLTLLNSYSVTDNLSLNATFSASVINESASQFDTSTNWGGWMEENPGGRYSMDLSVNYSVTDKMGFYLGYSQGDNYLTDGRFEMYTYDPLVTRYSLGMTLYF